MSSRVAVYILWVLAAGIAVPALMQHDAMPHRVAGSPEHWPQDSQIELDSVRATLVMFAHANCHCTRASMLELNKLLARYPGRIAAHVLINRCNEIAGSHNESPVFANVSPGNDVILQEDINGGEAQRFCAKVSGYLLFYAPSGELLFRGGIVPDIRRKQNPGITALIALLNGSTPSFKEAPAYGCSLERQDRSSESSAAGTYRPRKIPDVTSLHPARS